MDKGRPVDKVLADLVESVAVGGGETAAGPSSRTGAICATLRRVERTQYYFMVFYQALMAVLALAALILLVACLWLISKNHDVASILTGAGTAVTGSVAVFLGTQRGDARKQLAAAEKGLADYHCSAS